MLREGGATVELKAGAGGDFKVFVGNSIVLDKKVNEASFIGIDNDLCPEGQPKPYPSAESLDRVRNALDMAIQPPSAAGTQHMHMDMYRCCGDSSDGGCCDADGQTAAATSTTNWLTPMYLSLVVSVGLLVGAVLSRRLKP